MVSPIIGGRLTRLTPCGVAITTRPDSRSLGRENSDAKGPQSYRYFFYHPTTCHIFYNDGVFVMNKTFMLIHIFVYSLSGRSSKPKILTKK